MFRQKGNVLVYVLLAVMLMAALTYTISRDSGGQQQNQMTDARADLLATDMIKHAASAEMAVYQVTQFGQDFDDLLFDLPGTSDYETNTSRQMHHPQGGGLQIPSGNDNLNDPAATTPRGWTWQNATNVEWSPSAASDVIYSYIDINPDICARINEHLYKDPTIPVTTLDFDEVFDHEGTNADFSVSDCAACENRKSMCVQNGDPAYAFYTVVGNR